METPETVRIEDIASGKIRADDVFSQLDTLKVEVNVLRNELSTFLRALATIPPGVSQQDYYDTLAEKIRRVRAGIAQYSAKYNRLLPLINLAQIKLGQEAEVNGKSPQKT